MSDITSNLVYWGKLDGDATDSSGSGNDGTAIGSPTYTTGKIGSGVSLNGTTQNIQLPTSGTLGVSGAGARTFAAWIKFTSLASTVAIMAGGANVAKQAFVLYANVVQAGDLYLYLDGRDWYYNGVAFTAGTFYHVAVVYNGGAIETPGSVLAYVNGASVALTSTGTTTGVLATANSEIDIGNDPANAGHRFPGIIDEARIYSRALSSADVAALYAYTGASTTLFRRSLTNRTGSRSLQ
jgi:hypothetical protein